MCKGVLFPKVEGYVLLFYFINHFVQKLDTYQLLLHSSKHHKLLILFSTASFLTCAAFEYQNGILVITLKL
jgi:hypothetical protein